jgi:hypothetical protein
MHKLIAVLALAGGAALMAQPAPAKAEIAYPWCAMYSGGLEGSGATNCGFVSHQQCWDTVAQGRIGDCQPNPAYVGPATAPRPYSKRHRHVYPG